MARNVVVKAKGVLFVGMDMCLTEKREKEAWNDGLLV